MARAVGRELNRRWLIAGATAGLAAPWLGARAQAAADLPFSVSGRLVQGGFLIGRTQPGAEVAVRGTPIGNAAASGLFVVGLDRDEPAAVEVAVRRDGAWRSRRFPVAPGEFDVQRIDGLPEAQVAPTAPALLRRIAAEAELKAAAFASLDSSDAFRDGFDWPIAATRVSARFGGQRILNGQPMRPHYGIDLAAPTGTAIRAPAAGLVVLAEPDLHFEGGLTLIDHGQGLVAMFLHQSKLRVHKGDQLRRGQVIGEVGQTGRATGPHLCWRMKWRDRNLDPSLMVAAAAPRGTADEL